MRRYPCGITPLVHTREQVVFGRAGRKILPVRTKNHLLAFKHKIARDIARVLNALARVIRAIANLVDVINW